MISSQQPWVNVLGNAVYLADVHTAVLGDKACGKLNKNASQHFCILKGTVMVKLAQSKMLCHNIKLVLLSSGSILRHITTVSIVENGTQCRDGDIPHG